MSLFRSLDGQLRSEATTQMLALFLLALLLGLAFSWTGNPLTANNSWFTLTGVVRFGLALVALYLAAGSWRQGRTRAAGSCLLLIVVWLVSVPFSIVGYAGSHPADSLPLTLVLELVFAVSLFGICLSIGRLLPRLPWLSLPMSLAIVAVLAAADELFHYRLFNPVPSVHGSDWVVVAIWSAGAVVTLAWLLIGSERD